MRKRLLGKTLKPLERTARAASSTGGQRRTLDADRSRESIRRRITGRSALEGRRRQHITTDGQHDQQTDRQHRTRVEGQREPPDADRSR